MKRHIEGRVSILAKATIASVLLLILTMVPNLLKAQGVPGADLPLTIKTNVSKDVYIGVSFGLGPFSGPADLTVTGTDDPGGHTGFVIPPPNSIDITLDIGFLFAFAPVLSGNKPPWLDFPPMALDDNLEFSGESRATVAGFPNILTVVSGKFTNDGVIGTFNIGAGGGLPGAQPIAYDFLLGTTGGLDFIIPFSSFLSLNAIVGLAPELIDIPEAERKPTNFYILMNDGIQATEADWWLVLLQGGETLSFDLNTGTFVPGLRPTYQGPTIDIAEPVKFWSFPESPTGEVTLFFGIDTTQDGIVNESELLGNGFTYYF